ncbi:MAG: hypothetical protein IKZ95_06490 [Lachnospiraceae bacterium]|nr:hypothetical protein [Lachnospiraceae bacterium]
MKKAILAIIAALLIVPFVLGACGGGSGKDNTPDVPETQAQQIDNTQPTEGQQGATVDTAELVNTTKSLMEKVGRIQGLDSGATNIDYDTIYTDANGIIYNLVTDEGFQNFDDITGCLYDVFTEEAAQKYFPGLASLGKEGSDMPMYIYVDDGSAPTGLYMAQAAKGFADYTPITDIKIVNATDNDFIAEYDFDFFGGPMTLRVKFVKDGEKWKIQELEEINPQ